MKSQLVHTDRLLLRDRDAMYALLTTHFEGVKPGVFQADLAQKNWVLLLKDKDSGALKGFSTLLLRAIEFEGETISVVYSGDTIMDPSAWSSSALPRAWIAAINQLRRQYAHGKLYWLLICSGYRTYRFLPIFWQEFYPRYDAATPANMSTLMHFLARTYYKQQYDEATGVVHLTHPQTLRNELKGIPAGRQADPHIEFFQQQNAGYAQGDELVCLTEIRQENLTRAGRRMWFAESTVEQVGGEVMTA